MLWEIIILRDFLVILFLIPVGIFLVSTQLTKLGPHALGSLYAWHTAEKTWYDAHFMEFIAHFLRVHAKLWNEHAQLCLCTCAKLDPKIWVPTGPHHYYLAHPRASCRSLDDEKLE
jgi:hypothetical protein